MVDETFSIFKREQRQSDPGSFGRHVSSLILRLNTTPSPGSQGSGRPLFDDYETLFRGTTGLRRLLRHKKLLWIVPGLLDPASDRDQRNREPLRDPSCPTTDSLEE